MAEGRYTISNVKKRPADGTAECEASSPSLKSFKDLWFEDGSIIVQCPTASFRVHASILSTHSEVFRTMFAVASPSEDSVDGVPVVQVSDDAEMMYKLLKLLYYPK
jgi:hypothetical protein